MRLLLGPAMHTAAHEFLPISSHNVLCTLLQDSRLLQGPAMHTAAHKFCYPISSHNVLCTLLQDSSTISRYHDETFFSLSLSLSLSLRSCSLDVELPGRRKPYLDMDIRILCNHSPLAQTRGRACPASSKAQLTLLGGFWGIAPRTQAMRARTARHSRRGGFEGKPPEPDQCTAGAMAPPAHFTTLELGGEVERERPPSRPSLPRGTPSRRQRGGSNHKGG